MRICCISVLVMDLKYLLVIRISCKISGSDKLSECLLRVEIIRMQ